MALMLVPGSSVSHYRILSELGAGGMGEVYLALDTVLGRKVALKLLPVQFASDPERVGRFQQEARAASVLNHPSVAQIYEIGDSEGRSFISMEYVAGRPLSAEIADGIPAFPEVVAFAIQIAEALDEAHSKGIVHRDVKPANILVTPGRRLKILDFGIAKFIRASEADTASQADTLFSTKEGTVLGTVPYMSPEQLRGQSVDARSDIFSFGAVLYETASGRRAFPGPTTADIIDEILNSQPQPFARFNSDVPAELERIIRKCLEKDRERRYQSAHDAAIDLQNLQRDSRHSGDASPLPEKPSILVLPFEDVSPDRDNEYFSDGLTDEIIADLSQIDQLRVISRASAMKFKRASKDTRSIGRELNVQYIMLGSVRKAGSALRITAQLIDVATDTNLWSVKHKGTLDDIFDIQEQVSRSIVQALNLRLSPQQIDRFSEHPIRNPVAYQSYLRARHAIWTLQPEAIRLAEDELRLALQVAGHNELLYATLGWVYSMAVEAGFPFEDFMRKAEEAEKDLEALNPESPYLHGLRGMIGYRRGNTQQAIRNLEQARLAAPKNPDFLLLLSYCYTLAGKSFKARPLIETLLEVDPLTALNHAIRAFVDYHDGRFHEALRNYLHACELAPGNPVLKLFYVWGLVTLGRNEEALPVLDQITRDVGSRTIFTDLAVFATHVLRQEADLARAAVTEDLTQAGKSIEFIARFLMNFYTVIDARAEAIQWLETDIRLGFCNYPFLTEHSPFLARIRDDERVLRILDQVREAWNSGDA
jgi:serine/threonine protein kinase